MKKIKTRKFRNQADPLAKDLSNLFEKGKWVRFNELFQLQPKNKTITIRVPEELLNEIKKLAKREDTNYQKLIRDAMIDLVLRKSSQAG